MGAIPLSTTTSAAKVPMVVGLPVTRPFSSMLRPGGIAPVVCSNNLGPEKWER